jgi:ketosteroid isomerase-like protein
MNPQILLERAYAAFNARDIDAALAVMHPDVAWPNGMEGGSVSGHPGIRDYWTRQWGVIDPSVYPQRFVVESDGRVAVEVHQVVRDLAGNILKDATVQHVYALEDGLIKSMEIRENRNQGA